MQSKLLADALARACDDKNFHDLAKECLDICSEGGYIFERRVARAHGFLISKGDGLAKLLVYHLLDISDEAH